MARDKKGGSGYSALFLGYFIDQAALVAAYPTAVAGNYAIVGSTDTVWVWDTGTNAWIDTGTTATDEKVKTDATDPTAGYLDAKIGNNLKAFNNLVSVKRELEWNPGIQAFSDFYASIDGDNIDGATIVKIVGNLSNATIDAGVYINMGNWVFDYQGLGSYITMDIADGVSMLGHPGILKNIHIVSHATTAEYSTIPFNQIVYFGPESSLALGFAGTKGIKIDVGVSSTIILSDSLFNIPLVLDGGVNFKIFNGSGIGQDILSGLGSCSVSFDSSSSMNPFQAGYTGILTLAMLSESDRVHFDASLSDILSPNVKDAIDQLDTYIEKYNFNGSELFSEFYLRILNAPNNSNKKPEIRFGGTSGSYSNIIDVDLINGYAQLENFGLFGNNRQLVDVNPGVIMGTFPNKLSGVNLNFNSQLGVDPVIVSSTSFDFEMQNATIFGGDSQFFIGTGTSYLNWYLDDSIIQFNGTGPQVIFNTGDTLNFYLKNNSSVLGDFIHGDGTINVYFDSSSTFAPQTNFTGTINYFYLSSATNTSFDNSIALIPTNPVNVQDAINYLASSSNPVVNVSYTDLLTLIAANNLTVGQKYRITDFASAWYLLGDSMANAQLASGVEPLIVMATSVNELSYLAYSELYPKDIIYYNPVCPTRDIAFFWQMTGTPVPSYTGHIYYRKDTEKNLEAGYDWRNIFFRRWAVDYGTMNPYNGATVYSKYDVIYNAGDGIIYMSTRNSNSGNAISDTLWWAPVWDTNTSFYVSPSSTSFLLGGVVSIPIDANNHNDFYTFDGPSGSTIAARDCSIGSNDYDYLTNVSAPVTILNNIVANTDNTEYLTFRGIRIGNNSYNVTFHSNGSSDGIYNLTFKDNLSNCLFGRDIVESNFGDLFANCVFFGSAKYNNFGYANTGNFYCSTYWNNSSKASCAGNIYGPSCQQNDFDVAFSNNSVAENYQWNITGEGILNCNFGTDNRYNVIDDIFESVTTCDDFRRNHIHTSLFLNASPTDLTAATYVAGDYDKDIFQRSDGVRRLSYVDGTDTIIYQDPTS